MPNLLKSNIAIAICSLLSSVSNAEQPGQLEEIVVSAQKRQENILTVPLSINVVQNELLSSLAVDNLDDVAELISGLVIEEGSQANRVAIRGIGSGPNIGFEQSVGLFIDGVYAGRDRQFNAPLIDIDSIEVINGPQGTLFGKNTTAGAINIITAMPSDYFESHFYSTLVPEFEQYSSEFVVSGPIAAELNGRLAVHQMESEGYIDNKLGGEDNPDRNEFAARGSLVWTPSNQLEIVMRLERSLFEHAGQANRLDQAGDNEALFVGAVPDFSTQEFERFTQPESSKTDATNATLIVNWELSDHTISSTTGWSEYSLHDQLDVDFSPLEVLGQRRSQKYQQFSQEIRLSSETDKAINYLAGLYYQRAKLDDVTGIDRDFSLVSEVSEPNLMQIRNLAQAQAQQLLAAGLTAAILDQCGEQPIPGPGQLSAIQSYFQCQATVTASVGDSAEATAAGDAAVAAAEQGFIALNTPYASVTDFSQRTETWAAFAQINWQINQQWLAGFGLRYTHEDKQAQRQLALTGFKSDSPLDEVLNDPDLSAAVITIAQANGQGVYQHFIEDEYTPESISPSFKLQYQHTANTMLYFSYAKGFKSGGFNAVGITGDDANEGPEGGSPIFGFDDEEVDGFELGAKSSFFNDNAQMSVALFYNQYDDLQVSAFELGSFEVGNAAQATTQGVELQGRWAINSALTVNGSVTYLDAYYNDFNNATCTAAALAVNTECTQDLSGETLTQAPEWSFNLNVDYHRDIGSDLVLNSYLGVNFVDNVYLSQDLDPNNYEPSRLLVNARLGIGDSAGSWEVAVLAKNLTDQEVRGIADDVPGASGASFAYLLPPRSVAFQVKVSY